MKKFVVALVFALSTAVPAVAIVAAITPSVAIAQEEPAANEAAEEAEAAQAAQAELDEAASAAAAAQSAQAAEAAPAPASPPPSSGWFDSLADEYQKGGWVMHLIALAMAFGWAITMERTYYLYVKARVNKHQYLSQVLNDINAGRLDKAIQDSSKSQSPLVKIVKAGLERAKAGDPNFADAMDQASLANVPFLERNTPFLATIGNVATLLGLLGTVLGLIGAFGATAYADPSQKATLLSLSISAAMNTTAFGMITAIPSLIAFSILNGKTQRIIEDIQEASAIVIDKLTKQFQKA